MPPQSGSATERLFGRKSSGWAGGLEGETWAGNEGILVFTL